MWLNPQTNQVFTLHSEIRATMPNVSLPADLTDAVLASIGFAPVANGTQPAFDAATHKLVESAPPVQVAGVWTRQWSVVALTAEEIEAAYAATVPASVTRRQARQALVLEGKFDLVQVAIDAIPDTTQRKLMQIEWDDSLEFERTRPSLMAIGAAIGLTSEGIDDLFRTAVTL